MSAIEGGTDGNGKVVVGGKWLIMSQDISTSYQLSVVPVNYMKYLSVGITLGLLSSTPTIAGVSTRYEGFESSEPPRDWFFTGGAGFDWKKGLAYKGDGNGWVRSKVRGSWNAINTWVTLGSPVGSECQATAFLRVSPDVTDGYISVRSGLKGGSPGAVIKEIKIVGPSPTENNGYKEYRLNFQKPNSDMLFYVGLFGNGRDGWIQVDEVTISCNSPS